MSNDPVNNYVKAIVVLAMVATLSACAARRGGGMREMSQMINAADTNGDGVITREEFMSARATIFERADTNQDGKLTQDEIAALRGSFRGRR